MASLRRSWNGLFGPLVYFDTRLVLMFELTRRIEQLELVLFLLTSVAVLRAEGLQLRVPPIARVGGRRFRREAISMLAGDSVCGEGISKDKQIGFELDSAACALATDWLDISLYDHPCALLLSKPEKYSRLDEPLFWL